MRKFREISFRIALTLAAVGLAAACATPNPPAPLSQARSAYDELAAHPDVVRHAPVELYEAEEAVQRAERAWNQDGDEVETDHLAYVADKRIEIALAGQRRRAVGQAVGE